CKPRLPHCAVPQHDACVAHDQGKAGGAAGGGVWGRDRGTVGMTSPSGSTVDEAEAFRAATPEIEAFDIVLTDANGIGRGKIVRRHELRGIYEDGRHLPISILGLDIVGEDVHETGLIWDSGDGDLRAWPVPGTLVPLHGTNPPRGQVLLSMYGLDGSPMASDPRHALKRQVENFAARGLFPAGAFELEFFLLDNDRDGD